MPASPHRRSLSVRLSRTCFCQQTPIAHILRHQHYSRIRFANGVCVALLRSVALLLPISNWSVAQIDAIVARGKACPNLLRLMDNSNEVQFEEKKVKARAKLTVRHTPNIASCNLVPHSMWHIPQRARNKSTQFVGAQQQKAGE